MPLPLIAAGLIAGGLAAGIGSSLFGKGKKPVVPPFIPISAETEQRGAIEQNIASLPRNQALATGVNKFNQSELMKMLEAAIPNYEQIQGDISQALSSQVKGEIPKDVQDAIQRNAAGKSLYGGFGASEMQRNLTARDLGLTSLDITNKALDSAQRWMANTKSLAVPGQFDVTSMFVTPAQRLAVAEYNSRGLMGQQAAQNLINAAPSPTSSALSGMLGGLGSMAFGAGAGMLGGGGAGGIGGLLGGGQQQSAPAQQSPLSAYSSSLSMGVGSPASGYGGGSFYVPQSQSSGAFPLQIQNINDYNSAFGRGAV